MKILSFGKSDKQSLGDWLNPLLVREIRQSLRSKSFSVSVIGTSLLCLFAVLIGIISVGESRPGGAYSDAGKATFYFIYGLSWFVCCLILPVTAGNRFHEEAATGEYELFSITGISAPRIIIGKLLASFMQSLLMLSIAAPFMMSCYLLKGISAYDIFLMIMFLLSGTIVFTMLGIFIGSIKMSKGFYSMAQLAFVVLMFSISGPIHALLLNDFSGVDKIMMFFISLAFGAYITILAFLTAVYNIELPSKNRSFYLKLYLLSCAVIIPPFLFLVKDAEPRLLLLNGLFLAPAVLSSLFINVRFSPAPVTVRKKWRKIGMFRIFQPVFYPGQGSALIWFFTFISVLTLWNCKLFNGVSFPTGHINEFYLPICILWLVIMFLPGLFVSYFFPKNPKFVFALIGPVAASVAGVFVAASQHKGDTGLGLLLVPFTAPQGVMELHLGDTVYHLFIFVFVAVLLVGISSFMRQLKIEKALDNK